MQRMQICLSRMRSAALSNLAMPVSSAGERLTLALQDDPSLVGGVRKLRTGRARSGAGLLERLFDLVALGDPDEPFDDAVVVLDDHRGQ